MLSQKKKVGTVTNKNLYFTIFTYSSQNIIPPPMLALADYLKR